MDQNSLNAKCSNVFQVVLVEQENICLEYKSAIDLLIKSDNMHIVEEPDGRDYALKC